MNYHTVMIEGLDHLEHTVQDCPYLAAVVRQLKAERQDMVRIGRAQHAVIKATMKLAPELEGLAVLGEAMFGEGV